MGAEITVEQGSITVKKGDLHGINIDARNIPDLVPIISVAAAAANDGETVITVPRGLNKGVRQTHGSLRKP